jgi:malonyl CoA-acyl carrier protein transacylase/acyl carrier protein
VISGEREEVEHIVDSLNVVGIMARMLPVAGAFHSALVESAQAALAQAIAQAKIEPPKIPVYANATARPYNCDIDAIRNQLSQHVISPVEFVGQIEAMYYEGARIFVEVGPKSILTRLVSNILEGRKHTVVSLDGQGGKLQGLLQALGALIAKGVDIQLTALFEGRQVQQLDLSRLVELTRKPDLPPTTWLVNGGSVRQQSEAIGYTGRIPPLSLETAAQAYKEREIQQQMHREVTLSKSVPPTAKPAISKDQHSRPISVNPVIQPVSALPMSMPTSNGASQPQVPSVSPKSDRVRVPVAQDAALAAYQAYQQTMRQFLTLQEQVMQQFLSGSHMGQTIPSTPAATPTPQIPAAQANGFNGNYNGNGVGHYPKNGVGHDIKQDAVSRIQEEKEPLPSSSTSELLVPKVVRGADSRPEIPTSSFTPEPIVEPVLPSAPPTPAQSAMPNRSELMQILLRLVSDRTGYPVEMLGLDQDLEAELGIDSIKRVEILGALQKTLPSPLAASIQERMESLTRVKSLNSMVEQVLSSLPMVAPTPAPTVQTPTSVGAQSLTPLPDKITLTQTLLTLVSDRTGYPTEMLGLDQDLEAELGIDSIKRVEILGALQKSLPKPLAASIQSDMDSLTRVKSLNGIVEKLLATIAPVPALEEKNGLGKHLSGGKAARAM